MIELEEIMKAARIVLIVIFGLSTLGQGQDYGSVPCELILQKTFVISGEEHNLYVTQVLPQQFYGSYPARHQKGELNLGPSGKGMYWYDSPNYPTEFSWYCAIDSTGKYQMVQRKSQRGELMHLVLYLEIMKNGQKTYKVWYPHEHEGKVYATFYYDAKR